MGIDNESPTMSQVLDFAIERSLLNLHVSLPASIEKYDGKKADVRILLKRQLRRKKESDPLIEFELPVITNVPVIWPRTKLAEIHLPLAVGDTGTLLFAERSLDTWLVEGGSINPKDFRKHDLSDAQFIPGLKPFSEDTAFDPLRLVIKHDKGVLTITADGRLKFTNGVEELMDLVKQLIDKTSELSEKVSEGTTNTMIGANKFNNFTEFITLQGEVDTIGTKWDTIKE